MQYCIAGTDFNVIICHDYNLTCALNGRQKNYWYIISCFLPLLLNQYYNLIRAKEETLYDTINDIQPKPVQSQIKYDRMALII